MESKQAVSLPQASPPEITHRRDQLVVSARRFSAPRALLVALAGIFFLLALACNLLIIVASVPNARGIVLGAFAALVPTLVYAGLVLSFDRYEREPWQNLLGAFGWGAVIATLFSILLSGVAQGILITVLGEPIGGRIALIAGAPIIEESLKGLALLLLLLLYRDEFDGVLDGLIYGALIGLGFAMTENILYLGRAYIDGGIGGLGQLFLAREAFGGLGHALYTGTTGAAVGWARARYGRGTLRFIVPVGGWGLAVAQHSLWNFGAATVADFSGGAPPFLDLVAIQTALFIIPGLILLFVIARRSGHAESKILRVQLASEVASGSLTAEEYAILSTSRQRHVSLLSAFRHGGLRRWSLQQQFFQAAAELALCKHHDVQGETPAADNCPPEELHRTRLALLRDKLQAS
ncbi:MAG TPA: PrsW family intramembrane metalloprotease [Thermomicrobiales bacterium]|jgi:RsiW-degrading membrane proteinase PrsW (M82 family)